MMSQFTQFFIDTDPWNSSGHFPSSFQQTWGESPRFTAIDWNRRDGHVLERQQSTLGHCPPQPTSGHCPSQGYSFYPSEASIVHSLSGFGGNMMTVIIHSSVLHSNQQHVILITPQF